MKRRDDWQFALHHYFESVRGTPFCYGAHDCALFTSGAVAAMTNEDPAAEFRGRYKTAIGGLRKIRAAGFRDQREFVEKNFREVGPAFAATGDVCMMPGNVLGVCAGDRVAVAAEHGLGFLPSSTIERAFRV